MGREIVSLGKLMETTTQLWLHSPFPDITVQLSFQVVQAQCNIGARRESFQQSSWPKVTLAFGGRRQDQVGGTGDLHYGEVSQA